MFMWRFLKEFSVLANTMSDGKLLQLFTTVSKKKLWVPNSYLLRLFRCITTEAFLFTIKKHWHSSNACHVWTCHKVTSHFALCPLKQGGLVGTVTGGKGGKRVKAWPKPQALVYDILPSTTALFSYAIGSTKLSANKQFFVNTQTVVSLLQTTQIKQGVSFIATNKVYTSTNKTTIVWIQTELLSSFFYLGWMRLLFTCVLWC